MSVTTSNLIQGPGALYSGAFGAAEPTDATINATPAASAWTDLGGTNGGVKITVNQSYSPLDVDQLVDVPERRLTSREVSFATTLAEPTLNNLAVTLNGGVVTTGAGSSSFDPADSTAATQVTYTALLFDGYAPSAKRRRLIVRKVLSTDNVETSYKKDDQTLFSVTFSSHWVSSSIKPFRVIDQTS